MRKASIAVAGAAALALGLGAASPAFATTSGTERFTVVNTTTSDTAHRFPMSATGPIHAAGTDTQLNNNEDRFSFPQGSLLVRHTATAHSQSFDQKACTFRFSEQGTYRVLSGTGAYKDATGNGTYQLSGIGIGCDQHKPPRAFSTIIHAAGPLKI